MDVKHANKHLEEERVLNQKEARSQALLNYYKKRVHTLEKELVLQDKVVEICKESIDALPPIKETLWKPINTVSKEKTKEDVVMLLGDLHVGEEVNSEETGGLNEYNFDIFAKRYQHYVDSVVKITKHNLQGYQFNKLHIAAIGDMVSGIIHAELRENSRLDVLSQAYNGAYVVAQGIRELAQYFPEIEVFGVVGNHGRITEKKGYKRQYVSWDYVFYSTLALLLAKIKNVKTVFPKSFYYEKKINNHDFLFLHGSDIQSYNSIPWYGIQRAMARFNEVLRNRIEYAVLGHFHDSSTLDRVKGGELFINGSFIGLNEFSLGKLATGTDPNQKIFGVHAKHGVTWRYPIKLNFGDKLYNCRYNYELAFDKPFIAGELF